MNPQRIVYPGVAHTILRAPQDMKDCADLAVAIMQHSEESPMAILSRWTPTDEERAIIAAGGDVMLWVFGGLHPPIALSADTPVSEQILVRHDH